MNNRTDKTINNSVSHRSSSNRNDHIIINDRDLMCISNSGKGSDSVVRK